MTIFEELRARLDLRQTVEQYGVVLKRAGGKSWVGCCPFHHEKTPSFHVYDDGGWYCFGQCQMGGDVIKFIQLKEGWAMPELLATLADHLGLDYQTAQSKTRSPLYGLLKEAQDWLASHLPASPAEAYLHGRGFGPDTLARYGIGYGAPGLLKHLRDLGAEDELLQAAGLLNRAGGFLLQGRAIFPITDKQGRPIALAGRLLEGQGPKYINTAASPIFDKSASLFGWQGLDRRAEGYWLVEGYLDAMRLYQVGLPCALATMGTALTQGHLSLLPDKPLLLLMDSDAAGQEAMKRSLLNLSYPMDAQIGLLPAGKDPDDYFGAPEASAAALALQPIHEWLIDQVQLPQGLKAREQVATMLLPHITNTGSRNLDDHNRRYLLTRFGLTSLRGAPAPLPPDKALAFRGQLEQKLLALACDRVWQMNRYMGRCGLAWLSPEDFGTWEHQALYALINRYWAECFVKGAPVPSPTLRRWIEAEEPDLAVLLEAVQRLPVAHEDVFWALKLRFLALQERHDLAGLTQVAAILHAPPAVEGVA